MKYIHTLFQNVDTANLTISLHAKVKFSRFNVHQELATIQRSDPKAQKLSASKQTKQLERSIVYKNNCKGKSKSINIKAYLHNGIVIYAVKKSRGYNNPLPS